MITEDYCSKEIYGLLIKKGFDGEIHTSYDKEGYTQPSITLQMAMKWLRDVHCIFIEPTVGKTNGKTWYDFDIIPINKREIAWNHYDNLPFVECNSYEEACEVAIKYCLENLI